MRRILTVHLFGLPVLVGLVQRPGAQLGYAPLASASARTEHVFVLDEARANTIRFGGRVGSTLFNDTHSFDGLIWQQLSPATSPSARARATAAYDPVRREVVLFGGVGAGNSYLGDTWVWDGSNWSQRQPTSAPSPRAASAMAFDAFRQQVVLFGGWVPSGTDANDTWAWDGTNWRELAVAAPPARGGHRMVAARGALMLFGGYSTPQAAVLGDTWLFTPVGWLRDPVPGPSARLDHSMAFDALRGRTVLFGGVDAFSGRTPVFDDQTWEHGEAGWVIRAPSGMPSARANTVMVFDPTRERLVLHGGSDAHGERGDTLALIRSVPARAATYGTACTTSVGLPSLEADPLALAWRGSPFHVYLRTGLRSGGHWMLWIGSSRSTYNGVPLPYALDPVGVTGCQLNTAIDVTTRVFAVGSGSQVIVEAALCDCPVLVGRSLFLQALIVDPAAPRPVPIATTNGLELVVGDG